MNNIFHIIFFFLQGSQLDNFVQIPSSLLEKLFANNQQQFIQNVNPTPETHSTINAYDHMSGINFFIY